jgi:hypothetical protein
VNGTLPALRDSNGEVEASLLEGAAMAHCVVAEAVALRSRQMHAQALKQIAGKL